MKKAGAELDQAKIKPQVIVELIVRSWWAGWWVEDLTKLMLNSTLVEVVIEVVVEFSNDWTWVIKALNITSMKYFKFF